MTGKATNLMPVGVWLLHVRCSSLLMGWKKQRLSPAMEMRYLEEAPGSLLQLGLVLAIEILWGINLQTEDLSTSTLAFKQKKVLLINKLLDINFLRLILLESQIHGEEGRQRGRSSVC